MDQREQADGRRKEEIEELRHRGFTLREIGERFGISRQRVHQILGPAHHFLTASGLTSSEQRAQMEALREKGFTLREIGEHLGVSRGRVYSVLHQPFHGQPPKARPLAQAQYHFGDPVKMCGDYGQHFFDAEKRTCLCGQIPEAIFFATSCTCGAAQYKKPIHRPNCAAIAWMHKHNAWLDEHPDLDPPLHRVRYLVQVETDTE